MNGCGGFVKIDPFTDGMKPKPLVELTVPMKLATLTGSQDGHNHQTFHRPTFMVINCASLVMLLRDSDIR